MVLIAGAVIGGVLYTNAQKNKTEGQVIEPNTAAAAAPDYPVRRDGAVVVAGKDDARLTLDVYEDFLCPICREFEEANTGSIEEKIRDGSVRVRYHIVAILNNRSNPPGYSLDSANAALCVADGNRFPGFHATLFSRQPEEGARGFDKGQLIDLGTRLGVTTSDFTDCVNSGRYNAELQSAQNEIVNTPHLQHDLGNGQRSFGTPTVAVDERMIDTADPAWLTNLLSES